MNYRDRPIFPRPFGIRGSRVHWGSWGCPQRKAKALDDTVAHFWMQQDAQQQQDTRLQQGRAGYTATTEYSNSRILSYNRMQQDTRLDYRIHSLSTGYVAGLQDTQPINRIRGWTTGCTANQQDTWTHHGSSTLQQQGRGTEIDLWEQLLNNQVGLYSSYTWNRRKNSCKPPLRTRPKDWHETSMLA